MLWILRLNDKYNQTTHLKMLLIVQFNSNINNCIHHHVDCLCLHHVTYKIPENETKKVLPLRLYSSLSEDSSTISY